MTDQPSDKRQYTPRAIRQDLRSLKVRTQVVGRLKYGLSGSALVVFLVLIGWPQFHELFYKRQPTLAQIAVTSSSHNAAIHPEYKGMDKNNQPYTITADQGIEVSPEEVDLTHPKMTLILKSGDRVTLASASGKLNKVTNVVHLIKNVVLTHSQGYVLETTEAWIYGNKGSASGNVPVWGKGPTGDINAQGFDLTEHGNKVSFKGRVQLLITPSGGKKDGKIS